MRESVWLRVVMAALMVIVGGSLIAQAETHTMKVKVMKGDSQTVDVYLDGTTEVMSLEDFADGESRDFVAGEHTITVRRDGDQLTVLMDGDEFKHVNVHKGDSDMVWVSKSGASEEEMELAGSKVIMFAGEGEEGVHKVIKIHCEGDDDCDDLETIDIDIERIHGEHGDEKVFITRHGSEHEGHPVMIHATTAIADRALFKCPEDGTVLNIEKEKATQETYVCPVCGRAMERSEESEMKVMTIVKEVEEEHEE